ncbi:MAG: S41 family peptidase [Herbinix sp.]|nr:S41 family peptidase [Herbinix sp.]
MKKNFLTGLITGLCSAVLLFVIFSAVMFFVQSKDEGNANSSSVESAEEQTASTEDIPYDEIVDKLTFLQMLVDNYYLEDVGKVSFSDGIYKGFISSLKDPYSTYYTKEEYGALMESSSGVYCGIGATVSQNAKTGVITIVKPFATGPAYKVGILPGDILYKVNEEAVTGEDLTEVVSKMKGKEGTTVDISVVREGSSEPLEFTVTRQEIEVPTIEYKMLDNKVGYIIITQFDEVTVNQFINAIDSLEKDGMKGLVVDVRNNPGGLLQSVVKILDRLLPPELLVYTEDKNGKREEEESVDEDKVSVPIAVLINGQSASASEIFAGTLQDYKVATIIGTTSFGKGIVQKVIPLSDGTAVKLTISKYYTPNGRNIHGIGITPDIEVELNEELQKEVVIPIDKDNQLQEAISTIMNKMK